MLVLTRRIGESIQIGKDIVVVVLEMHSGQVRLGVDAPREVSIFRTELLTSAAQQKAARGTRHGRSK